MGVNLDIHNILYILSGISIAGLTGFFIWKWSLHNDQLSVMNVLLKKNQNEINTINDRLKAIFQISQKFVVAENEVDIIDELLFLSMKLTNANGASFVPFDTNGQPLATIRIGEFPQPVPDAWLEYIASPTIRSDCMNCTHYGSVVFSCPLLHGPFSDMPGLYCLPVRSGNRELGILNLYLPDTSAMEESTKLFIGSLLDVTVLAIESVRLRTDERQIINQLRSSQHHTDIQRLLRNLLETVCDELNAEYGLLLTGHVPGLGEKLLEPPEDVLTCGELPATTLKKIYEIAQQLYVNRDNERESLKCEQYQDDSRIFYILGLLIAGTEKNNRGGILIVSRDEEAFDDRHLYSLRTVASQVSYVLSLKDQLAEITYRSMMEERIRLAREIHDGLAQTLGYLKLLMTQMQGQVERGEFNKLNRMIQTCAQTISNAYQDAREAIDGLRVMPSDLRGQTRSDMVSWIKQTISEFRENQEIHPFVISLEMNTEDLNLSPEIQAQLIRIVQEAFSNVRKHAHAKNIVVSVRQTGSDLVIEIDDDGLGFSSDEVPNPSRYGLRGMRERAELIGADFQIISFIGKGTTVRIRLPLSVNSGKKAYEAY